MNYITTTELRTKSTHLIQSLRDGQTVNLLHRSKVIGQIAPPPPTPKVTDINKLMKAIKALGIKTRTTPAQRQRIYRQHLQSQYGKPRTTDLRPWLLGATLREG